MTAKRVWRVTMSTRPTVIDSTELVVTTTMPETVTLGKPKNTAMVMIPRTSIDMGGSNVHVQLVVRVALVAPVALSVRMGVLARLESV